MPFASHRLPASNAVFTLAFVLLCSLPLAAQEIDYFPYAVGDRWVYEVKGTTTAKDTIDAIAEWLVTEVRSDTEIDTVYIETRRMDEDGTVREHLCGLTRYRTPTSGVFVQGITTLTEDYSEDRYWDWRHVCTAGGGFPFSGGAFNTSYYPYLFRTDSMTARSPVIIGSILYELGTHLARFNYSNSTPRNLTTWSTSISATLAEGVGFFETTIVDGVTGSGPTISDTVRSRLIGAEIGGVLYGDIGAVQLEEEEPIEPIVTLRAGPNPASKSVVAEVRCGYSCPTIQLSLLDARGRVLTTQSVAPSSPTVIDMRGLPSGVYAIRAETGDAVLYRRISLVR